MLNRKLWHCLKRWGRHNHHWKIVIICRSPHVWKKLLLIVVPSNAITCSSKRKKTPSPSLTSSCRHLSSPFSLSLNSSPLHPLCAKCIGWTCSHRVTFDLLRPGSIIKVHETLFTSEELGCATFLRGHAGLELDLRRFWDYTAGIGWTPFSGWSWWRTIYN